MTQIERHLRTEELYKQIISLIPEPVIREIGGETPLRGLLDAILSQGKIEGRLSSLPEGMPNMAPEPGEVWRSRRNAQDTVEIISFSPEMIVTYLHTDCPCRNNTHAQSGHRNAEAVYQFTELYEPTTPSDRLIEDWQRIVDASPQVKPVDFRLVGRLEAAQILCVSPPRCRSLEQRDPRFPEVFDRLAMGPVWLATAMEDYQRERKKTRRYPKIDDLMRDIKGSA